MNLKTTKKYYFSVEGETEKWYLEWLKDQINSCQQAAINVSFKINIEKNPLRNAKRLNINSKTTVYHLCDYESDEDIHVKQFKETMDRMKAASGLGKQITYRFGYTNLTFDLWIVLHVSDCNGSLAHRSLYLSHINRGFHKKFNSMDDYKHEKHFKSCLQQLNLDNVRDAIRRAEAIMAQNVERGYTLMEYKGFYYYKENPSLEIWTVIKTILEDCELLEVAKL